ncbi:unnamed protein product [Adineta steineri]|uniref:F-box domain-containing protein n=1 Tax=Adineta steineri TaxID=433720 RepID=A0A818YHD8_9BILA|nr:unnamed protein product [Adineta steineri]CAF3752902.1 unnamed protein product [Adineta steineri]
MSRNISSSTNQRQLESFPDELFLEIFQYIDILTLRSFKGLNKRIDSIINTVNNIILVVELTQNSTNDFAYFFKFNPKQIFHLKLCSTLWSSLNFMMFTELRSLTFDCDYLTKDQVNQIIQFNLPYLKRLSIFNMKYFLQQVFFYKIIRGEHFPSLKTCHFDFNDNSELKLNSYKLSSRNKIRSLSINKWNWSRLDFLSKQFQYLFRFETYLEDSYSSIDLIQPCLTLKYLKITFNTSVISSLEQLLKWVPNLIRLRVRGNLEKSTVNVYFIEMSNYLPTLVPYLQQFDCELYCYMNENEYNNPLVIQKYSPFFERVRCLYGQGGNRCFTTDMETYSYGK